MLGIRGYRRGTKWVLASIFSKEKVMGKSEISVGITNTLGQVWNQGDDDWAPEEQ